MAATQLAGRNQMAEVERKEHPVVRRFSEVVATLDEGNANFEIQVKLERAMEKARAVARRTGKPAKFKLKLVLTGVVNEKGTLDLFQDHDTVEPKLPNRTTLGFVTEEGKLTFTQPTEQRELDFSRPRVIEGGNDTPKDIGSQQQAGDVGHPFQRRQLCREHCLRFIRCDQFQYSGNRHPHRQSIR